MAISNGSRYLTEPDTIPVSTVKGGLDLEEAFANSTLRFSSVSEMLQAASEAQEGQPIVVDSFYVGEGRGGGIFFFSSTSAETPDGGVHIEAPEGVFSRLTEGLVATPYWYGIPTNSDDVDYTAEMQSLISQPRFALPLGFTVSTSTLYPQSNTWGLLQDATIKLLSGQDNFTPVFSLEGGITGASYYGGRIDGNRGAETGQGASGQDGGMHGIRVYSCAGFEWHYPIVNNCATDGVYINAADGESVVGLRIYSISADNNSRQGLSVINCTDVQFLEGSSWTNTSGKLPEAGIDIEPNNDGEDVNITFSGRTLCEGNNGRGFVIYSAADGILNATFDLLESKNNGLESIRLTGTGVKTVTANIIDCDGDLSLGGSEPVTLRVTGQTKCSRFVIEAAAGADVTFASPTVHFGAYGFSSSTADNATLLLDEADATSRTLHIEEALIENSGTSTSSTYAILAEGAGLTLDIKKARLISPRGARLEGVAENCKIEVLSSSASIGESVILTGSGWEVTGVKTVQDGVNFIRVDGDYNQVSAVWDFANAKAIAFNSANYNTATVRSKNATTQPVSFNSTSTNNGLLASYLHRSDAGSLVSDSGTGNQVIGCFPFSINTTA